MDMAWYAQILVRGNLGKYFIFKGLVTKNGLRHEEIVVSMREGNISMVKSIRLLMIKVVSSH
jgi:hypothetical protein